MSIMERTYIGTAGQFGDEDDGNDKAHNNIAVDGEFYPLEHHWQYCDCAWQRLSARNRRKAKFRCDDEDSYTIRHRAER